MATWVAKGCPRSESGYDVEEVRAWRQAWSTQLDTESLTDAELVHEKLLADCAVKERDAELKGLRNALARGELVMRSDVSRDMTALVVKMRTRLRSISTSVASLMSSMEKARVKMIVDGVIERALRDVVE